MIACLPPHLPVHLASCPPCPAQESAKVQVPRGIKRPLEADPAACAPPKDWCGDEVGRDRRERERGGYV